MAEDLIDLNNREKGLNNISREEKYENCKLILKKNIINDIENKIQMMRVLYEIKREELYLIDGYSSFDGFIEKFLIKKTQAYLYIKIYEYLVKGDLNVEDIKQKGVMEVYKSIKAKEIESKESKQNPIKPLRFQLKSEDSYNFYKNHAKLTGFILDKLFLNKQELLQEFVNEFENLKSKKTKEEIIE